MSHGFTAKPLARQQIDQAFPLVNAVAPGLTVQRWRDFAARALPDAPPSDGPSAAVVGRGIMTVQNDRGYILGLFSHGVCDHLRLGRVLGVDNLMVADMFDAGGAMEALLEAMKRLAREAGCVAIHTDLPEHLPTLPDACRAAFDHFGGGDHASRSQRLIRLLGEPPCRPLAPAPVRVRD